MGNHFYTGTTMLNSKMTTGFLLILSTILWLAPIPLLANNLEDAKQFLSLLVNRKFLSGSRKLDPIAITDRMYGVSLNGLEKNEKRALYRCIAFQISAFFKGGFGEELSLIYQEPTSQLSNLEDEFDPAVVLDYTFLGQPKKITFFYQRGGGDQKIVDILTPDGRLTEILINQQGRVLPAQVLEQFKPYLNVFIQYQEKTLTYPPIRVSLPHYFVEIPNTVGPSKWSALEGRILIQFRELVPMESQDLKARFGFLSKEMIEDEKQEKIKEGVVPAGDQLALYLLVRTPAGDIREHVLTVVGDKYIETVFTFIGGGGNTFFDSVRRKILLSLKEIKKD